jgi:hypothetical protein
MKKWWVKLLIGLAVILLPIGILLFTSGNDSKKRVEQYRNHLLAAGEKLSVDDYIPARVARRKMAPRCFKRRLGRFRGGVRRCFRQIRQPG